VYPRSAGGATTPARAGRVAWLVGLAMLGVAVAHGRDVTLSDVLDDPSAFEGQFLVLQGTLVQLEVRASRKGHRYYTFRLADQGRDVVVVAQGAPSCKDGAAVKVRGRFDAFKKRLDASTVTCE